MSTNDNPIGVLLLGFGGPDSPEAIEPFVVNIMGGRVPSPVIIEKVKARYDLIGGSSPLPQITANQGKALEDALNKSGNFIVEVGMLHWHPYIDEALEKLVAAGVKEVVALTLAPFYATVSTKAYFDGVEKVIAEKGYDIKVRFAGSWFNHPMFIEAVAKQLNDTLEKLDDVTRSRVQVIFSAHSLPQAHIQAGDPYVEQFRASVQLVLEALKTEVSWHMAYQSKGGGQGQWLGPEVEEVMDDLVNKGLKDLLLVPIGFCSDHIETLYDIDIAIKGHAEKIGANFYRAASLNTAPQFIEALADVTREEIEQK